MRKTALAIAIALATGTAGATDVTKGGSASGMHRDFYGNGTSYSSSALQGYNAALGAASGAGVSGNLVGVTPGGSSVSSWSHADQSVQGFSILGAAGAMGQLGEGFGVIGVAGIGGDVNTVSNASGGANVGLAFSHRAEADYQAFGTGSLDLQVVDLASTSYQEYSEFVTIENVKEWEVSWKTPGVGADDGEDITVTIDCSGNGNCNGPVNP